MQDQDQERTLVYFFAKSNFGDSQIDFIKIGHTSRALSIRQAALQTGNEAEIWEIGVIPFETVDEASIEEERILSRFGAFRARGEWFYATPRIIQFIQNYAVQHTDLLSDNGHPETVDLPEMTFGKQLADKRNAEHMTQDELAIRLGCTRGYISFLENNRGLPGKIIFDKLIEIFDEFSEPSTESRSDSILAVEMEDRSWISEDTAIDTFIKVIMELGIEEVKNLGLSVNRIPLVADHEYTDKAQRKVEIQTETYYIVSGTNTVTKKKILDDIADQLECDITVFANPRA